MAFVTHFTVLFSITLIKHSVNILIGKINVW